MARLRLTDVRSFRFLASLAAASTGTLVLAADGPDASPTPPSGEVLKMEPYEVVSPRLPSGFHEVLQSMDHALDGPFPEIRSGPLVEAILWRHRYLAEHTADKAVIVTTGDGSRIHSATTIYSLNGKVYMSSNALGEHRLLKGYVPADLDDPKKVARVQAIIQASRDVYLPGGPTRADMQVAADDDGNVDLNGGLPVLGKLLVMAEETGDYSVLAMQAGGTGKSNAHAAAMVQTFNQPTDEILAWTFKAMHDPARAGLVPVALSEVSLKNETTLKTDKYEALIFDWEGVHYTYSPDYGTQGLPIPGDPITGKPYLCVHDGGALECAYFMTTFLKEHPEEKAVVLPGAPVAVAFTEKNKIGIFGLALGPYQTKPMADDALARIWGSPGSLARQRDRLAQDVKQPIPEQLLGDSADMQMRRVFLAFQQAGIPCHLKSGDVPELRFTFQGSDFIYGADYSIRRATGGS
jgi:hypothetical protein